MQTLMVKSGPRYRKATAAEVAEVAGYYVREDLNRARPTFTSPTEAAAHLRAMYAGMDHETFTVLFLNGRRQLIEIVEMFRGTIDSSAVHPREVVKECLWRGAHSVILAHNHPSGISEPSGADIRITTRLKDALRLIDVQVLDHLIIGREGFYSLSQSGEL